MKAQRIIFAIFIFLFASVFVHAQSLEKTSFQTAEGWSPEVDLRSDIAMVYGMNDSFPQRLKSWKDRGYEVQFMTGAAWGGYQDYIEGRFDGKNHLDEGQVQQDGSMIMHGGGIPYMVPSKSYIEYLKTLVAKAIDGGATAIYMEEPEFWARAGYSESFKREWQEFYKEPWQAQHESPEATFRSAKLKYNLYFRALEEIFHFAKQYSTSKGKAVKCYVPTHSLISYSAWQIVSPESFLAHLTDSDGYIAQVWTGTARTPINYNGSVKERTFENAYLEYASTVAMTKPTGRRVYFLTDPIEDNPNHTWEDYKINYEATFTAQLMQPSTSYYEVMPWPNRIFLAKYQVEGSKERQPIPPSYATELMVLINTLNDMPITTDKIEGTQGVGVMISDTLMFQRFPEQAGFKDPTMSNFYGMALPLMKQGIPVQLIQMENLEYPDTLKDLKVLVMTYSNMKPQKPEYHQALVNWVKNGGTLIYCGKDADPFQTIREWWNQGDNKYPTPIAHLFALAGIELPQETKTFDVGEGSIAVIRKNPQDFNNPKDKCEVMLSQVRGALQGSLKENNRFVLHRGPYDIIAVLEESVSDKPCMITGPVIDLYDPNLPVCKEMMVKPGQRALLYNLNRNTKKAPCILAAASRAYDEKAGNLTYSCTLKGPDKTNGIARLLLSSKPGKVEAKNSQGQAIEIKSDWDEMTKTLLIRYANNPDGVKIAIEGLASAEGTKSK